MGDATIVIINNSCNLLSISYVSLVGYQLTSAIPVEKISVTNRHFYSWTV